MEFIGTDLKYLVNSTGEFSLDDNEWDVIFRVDSTEVTMTKRNTDDGQAWTLTCSAENMGMKPCGDGSWVFLIDSSYFGEGRLTAVLYAYITDADFDADTDFSTLDGVRTEIRRYSLETLVTV